MSGTVADCVHNRLDAHYKGDLEVLCEFIGGYEERCKVCGQRYIQFYSWKPDGNAIDDAIRGDEDRCRKNTVTSWLERSIWMA